MLTRQKDNVGLVAGFRVQPALVRSPPRRTGALWSGPGSAENTKTGLVFGFSKNQILVAVIPGLKNAEDFPRTKGAEDFTRAKLFLDFFRKLF